jgi:hypothetical protein
MINSTKNEDGGLLDKMPPNSRAQAIAIRILSALKISNTAPPEMLYDPSPNKLFISSSNAFIYCNQTET